MPIDWFTVIAQIINFLVLAFLLQRFLYGPILKAIQARQEKIDSRWQEAEREQAEAREKAESYRQMIEVLKEQRQEQELEMKASVEAQRQASIQQVREEVEKMQEAWREGVRQERDKFLQGLRQQIGQEACRIARHALADLANADLEEQVLEVWMDRLRRLDREERQAISQSLQESRQAISICSRFDLPHRKRQVLGDFFQELLGEEHPLRFVTSPAPLCGIEVKLGGYEIVWSLDDYLQNLEGRLSKTLNQEVERDRGSRQPAPARHSGRCSGSVGADLR